MGALSFGLMGSPPERPCDDVCGLDAPPGQAYCDTADFLDRPADQREVGYIIRVRIVFGGDAVLAWWRMTAIMAKASITNET
jgi:hypothetical protein